MDSALAAVLPHAPRWDYGVGYRPSGNREDVMHWVEVHPATDGEVQAVVDKLEWLKKWLGRNTDTLAAMESRYVWVSSGSTRLSPASPGRKRLAQRGCVHVGKVYVIQ